MRSVLVRSILVGICALPAVPLTASPATASPALMNTVSMNGVGPQHSATPNVTAEIGYASEQVHPGGQDTMTVSLINHGPQSLDDNTSVHVTVTMPQHTEVNPTVVEAIRGNAPAGSRNAVPTTRSIPLTQVFVRSAPGFFDVVVPAGSFGNSVSFRTYTFTLNVSPTVSSGAQLAGGGVAVALENYIGLTVAKSVVPPPPVVVTASAKPPHKPSAHTTAGTSEQIRAGCSMGSGMGSGTMAGGSGGSGSASSGDVSGGGASGGSTSGGGANGTAPCMVPTLAATGTNSALPLALGTLALAVGAALMLIAHRFNRRAGR